MKTLIERNADIKSLEARTVELAARCFDPDKKIGFSIPRIRLEFEELK